MAEKICSQTNIPTVDNTVPDCNDITKEQCVIATTARVAPIPISIGDPYNEVLDRLLTYILSQDAIITDLTNRVTTLETFH